MAKKKQPQTTEDRVVGFKGLYYAIFDLWDSMCEGDVTYVNAGLEDDDTPYELYCEESEADSARAEGDRLTKMIERLYNTSGVMFIAYVDGERTCYGLVAESEAIERLGTRELVEALKPEFDIINSF